MGKPTVHPALNYVSISVRDLEHIAEILCSGDAQERAELALIVQAQIDQRAQSIGQWIH